MKTKLVAFGLAIGICLWWLGAKTGLASTRGTARKETHQSYPIAENGRLLVDNVNGKIRIIAWDRAEIEVAAFKRADTESDLDQVEIEINSRPDQVQIHTKYPRRKWSLRRKDNSVNVDYEIKAPGNVRLENVQNVNGSVEITGIHGKVVASTVNGRLVAEGLAADSELGSVNGSVQASFENLAHVKRVSVKTVNGRVAVTLPADSNAEVSAHTLNGSIRSGPELTAKKNWPVGRELHGTLGKGGSQIKAETVNGSIQITRAEPSEVDAQKPGQTRLERE